MDWFLLLLAITAVLRGLGSGMITGIIMVTFPVRRKLDLFAYVTYTRIEYKGKGVRVYVATTFLGAILLGILSYEAFLRPETPAISWLIIASFIATVLGLVGAFKAFPAMAKLWKAPDDDEAKLVKILERFEYWGTFSALGHLIHGTCSCLGVDGSYSLDCDCSCQMSGRLHHCQVKRPLI